LWSVDTTLVLFQPNGHTKERDSKNWSERLNDIMEIVFKAKHWQIFGTFVLLAFIGSMIENINPIVDAVFYIFMVSVILGWILILGHGLSRRLNTLDSKEFKIFEAAGILLILSASLSKLLMTAHITEPRGHGIVMMIFLGIYVLTLLTITFTYPAKTLKRLETKEETDINDYFGDIFGLMFWPIGIWTIQPRINKFADDKVD
jgi:hypothetical protein